jgi:ATP-dependent exoDNAse (exonuclease V) beta subunit
LPGDNIDVLVEQLADGEERPRGPRFGTLVHALIADAPLELSDPEVLNRLAAAHGRVLGATRDEIEAASVVVERVLHHPLCIRAARASQAGRCYRETPITLRLASGVLIEGTVDLAFEEDDEITVIDFKTDRELAGDLPVYRRQLQIYAHAIATATDRPARGVLMKI